MGHTITINEAEAEALRKFIKECPLFTGNVEYNLIHDLERDYGEGKRYIKLIIDDYGGICEHCGRRFSTGHRKGRNKYCNDGCKREAAQLRLCKNMIETKKVVPIEELDIPTRAINCLRHMNIKYADEISNFKACDLLKVKNFGRTSFEKLKEEMTKLGINFKKWDA